MSEADVRGAAPERVAREREGPRAIPFDGNLGQLRQRLGRQAAAASVAEERVPDFVFAVNEVATNALLHGREPISIRIWSHVPGGVICEVSDSGPGMADPLAGRAGPAPLDEHGLGLWLARQFCDLTEVRSSARGTTVRLRVEPGRVRR
ncbi:MAG: ATP-binding protein [Gaiellaceae bacterium]